MLSDVVKIIVNVYYQVLDLGPIISDWLTSLVTWKAVIWFLLGLVVLPICIRIRIRFGFWRMRSRLAHNENVDVDDLVPCVIRLFSKASPKAPIRMGKHEIQNILDILEKALSICSDSPDLEWRRLWTQLDTGWLERFFSRGRIIGEPVLQDALAKAFMYEAVQPGRFDHRDITILTAICVEDWRIFTAICNFACCFDGRSTPVVLNYEDSIYEKAGLSEEILAGLVAAGLITHGGTGETYTLDIPIHGLRVTYFDEDEFVVRPLLESIPRPYLGGIRTQPHPLDKRVSVGVVDYTRLGRVLALLTSCSKVDGFSEYLTTQWGVYLRE